MLDLTDRSRSVDINYSPAEIRWRLDCQLITLYAGYIVSDGLSDVLSSLSDIAPYVRTCMFLCGLDRIYKLSSEGHQTSELNLLVYLECSPPLPTTTLVLVVVPSQLPLAIDKCLNYISCLVAVCPTAPPLIPLLLNTSDLTVTAVKRM